MYLSDSDMYKAMNEAIRDLETKLEKANREADSLATDVQRVLRTLNYIKGIPCCGGAGEIRDDQSIEDYILEYVKGLETVIADERKRASILLDSRKVAIIRVAVWRFMHQAYDRADLVAQDRLGIHSPAPGSVEDLLKAAKDAHEILTLLPEAANAPST